MPDNENKSQIKSRQRVANHGEVFTNPREVNAMLDLVRDESYRLDSRFLEPACGDGNFLIVILRRKLSLLKDIKSQTEWEFKSLIAVGSCYGIDLLPDNAEACRERLFAEVMDQMIKKDCSDGYEESLRYMLQKNIVCGDALTYRTAEGKPITFCVSKHFLLYTDKGKKRDDLCNNSIYKTILDFTHLFLGSSFPMNEITIHFPHQKS